jgi:hypothetical protein
MPERMGGECFGKEMHFMRSKSPGLQDSGSLMRSREVQEEPEGRPAEMANLKTLGWASLNCLMLPLSSCPPCSPIHHNPSQGNAEQILEDLLSEVLHALKVI